MNAATNQPSILTLRLGQSDQAGHFGSSVPEPRYRPSRDYRNRGLNVTIKLRLRSRCRLRFSNGRTGETDQGSSDQMACP